MRPRDRGEGEDLPRNLINHRKVCRAFDISTQVLMRAVNRGEFPEPHSMLGNYYFFDRRVIEHRLQHGTWPSDAKFRGATRT